MRGKVVRCCSRRVSGRTVRLVYLDEAGISKASQEPFAVEAGIIINADKELIPVERHIDALVQKHIPPEYQSDFVFHATELFNGGGKVFQRDKWPLDKRLAIADELARIPRTFSLPIAFGWTERANFPQTFDPASLPQADHALGAHLVAFVTCAMAVEHWMRVEAPEEVCLLIVEDNDRARKLMRETHLYYQNPQDLAQFGPEALRHFPFTKIKEEPLFQRKRKSSALQIADFCAYVWKRFLMNQSDERYLRFLDPMRGLIAAHGGES